MSTIAEIKQQVQVLTDTINAIPAPTAPVATQADLDAVGSALTAAQSAAESKKATA